MKVYIYCLGTDNDSTYGYSGTDTQYYAGHWDSVSAAIPFNLFDAKLLIKKALLDDHPSDDYKYYTEPVKDN